MILCTFFSGKKLYKFISKENAKTEGTTTIIYMDPAVLPGL